MDQRRRDRRINTARQPRHYASFSSELIANARDLIFDHGFRRPITTTPANREQKIPQHLRPEWRMRDFRMKLHAINPARLIFHRVQSIVSECGHIKSGRHFSDVIAMTHPHVEFLRQPLEQKTSRVEHFQARITKLTIRRSSDRPTELTRKDLEPVADSERWTLDGFEPLRIWLGRGRVVNRRRPAGKDQTSRRAREDRLD